MNMRFLFTIAIAALCLVSCQSANHSDIAGVYTLSEVNGIAIPGTVSHDGVPLTVSSGTFVINANGTCISKTVFTPPGGKPTPREVRATYTIKDSKLIMAWEGAGVTEGEVTGDMFVMDNHGMIMEYVRGGASGN